MAFRWSQFGLRANIYIALRRVRGLKSLPLNAAYLTREEVFAVRLYSGPAYQPINDFLQKPLMMTEYWTKDDVTQ